MNGMYHAASFAVSTTAAYQRAADTLVKTAGKLSISRASLKKEKSKAALLDLAKPIRDNMMEKLKDIMFGTWLDDPHLMVGGKRYMQSIITCLWDDIHQEIESTIEAAILQQHQSAHHVGPRGKWPAKRLWLAWRRFILHHYLPHDKSIFGKFRDPVFLVMFFLTCLPIHGLRFVIFVMLLIMILFPGPPDEYQLLGFILTFKGFQFVNGGVICMAMATVTSFICYSKSPEKMLECIDTDGPGGYPLWGEGVDYLGNIVLPNFAFSLLRFAKQHARTESVARIPKRPRTPKKSNSGLLAPVKEVVEGMMSAQAMGALLTPKRAVEGLLWPKMSSRDPPPTQAAVEPLLDEDAGADEESANAREVNVKSSRDSVWLRRIFNYDVKCFYFSMAVLALATLRTCDLHNLGSSTQFAMNIFWCRVLYSLLTFPWLIFTVSAGMKLLTHVVPTGYNEDGACVPFALPVVSIKEDRKGSKGRRRSKEKPSAAAGASTPTADAGADDEFAGYVEYVDPEELHGLNVPTSLMNAWDRF